MSSSHVALPREGHLEAVVHVMAHVGQKYNSRLVYDRLYPEIDHSVFKECDWSEFYIDAKEAILVNAPESCDSYQVPHIFMVIICQSYINHLDQNQF